MDKTSINALLLSDTTGETVSGIASILVAQYPGISINIELIPFLRTQEKAREILVNRIKTTDIIIHTLVDDGIIRTVNTLAKNDKVEVIAVLKDILSATTNITNISPLKLPGQHYQVNKQYFDKINAIDFAMHTDDGQKGERLLLADVIILGISRTSKTPTCIYLAYQGIRAANVPLILNQELPPKFFTAMDNGIPIVGLIASVNRLKEIRTNRIKTLGKKAIPNYIEIKTIQEELIYARLFFERYSIPFLDVTRRSIEETAAAIRVMITK